MKYVCVRNKDKIKRKTIVARERKCRKGMTVILQGEKVHLEYYTSEVVTPEQNSDYSDETGSLYVVVELEFQPRGKITAQKTSEVVMPEQNTNYYDGGWKNSLSRLGCIKVLLLALLSCDSHKRIHGIHSQGLLKTSQRNVLKESQNFRGILRFPAQKK